MNTQSVKRRREDDDGSAITTDRLSQLPQPILHQILSLLSQKDAVQTSVLSKSWRYLWHGRLNVEFRDINCFDRTKEFWSIVDKTLQRYLDQNLSLQKFLVDIFHDEVDFVLLEKWIPVLIMNMGVRSFNLIFSGCTESPYPLPLVVFQSESLVELHLTRCDLNTLKPNDNIMLNNLQTLRLHDVHITDEIFEKIISSCPLIENLGLLSCIGLKSIKLHKHHNIKDFDCSVNGQTIIDIFNLRFLESDFGSLVNDQIIIEIENLQILESVRIRNCGDWFLCNRNTHFPHLKSLNLHSVKLPAKMFENFSSFFPCLSELVLDSCHGLKEFRLFSSSIKRLTIKMDLGKRIKAFIDTPNILYFEYLGRDFLPSIKFTTTSNEWKSQIALWYKLEQSDNDATSWSSKLNKLLKALSQSHIILHITLDLYQKLQINDSIGGLYKPVVVEHLKLWGCNSSFFDPTILNCFFQICRPRFIHIDMYSNVQAKRNLIEYVTKLIPDETGYYFGLQDLEEVSTEVFDMKAREWHCVKGTSSPALCLEQPIRFQLTWKEQ